MVKLTKKQKGFVKDYVETGNGTQAALKNYDTENPLVAASIATENLTKPYIVKAIADRIPDDLLEEKHLALLNKEDEKGIDAQAVAKGLDMAYKLKGSYAAEKQITTNLHVTISPENKELADKFEEALKINL